MCRVLVGAVLTTTLGFGGGAALSTFGFGAGFGFGAAFAFGSLFLGAGAAFFEASAFSGAACFGAGAFFGAGTFFAGATGSGMSRARFEVRVPAVGASSALRFLDAGAAAAEHK